MLVTYDYDKIPRGLFGKTFDTFNFELIGGHPVSLTVGDGENEMIRITGLEEIAMYRSNYPYYMKPTVCSFPWAMKHFRKSELIEMYEKKLKYLKDVLPKYHAAEMFELFLTSIMVNPHSVNKPDIMFAHNYYGIDIKVSGSETANLDNTEGVVENASI